MIVNADDFGRSANHNAAVIRAFEQGLVSSATVMATMPGFGEACALAAERRLEQHVGVHLTLTAGEPLTAAIADSRRFCDADGRFFKWRAGARIWRLGAEERDAVAAELRAQVMAVRAAGLPVTHVDSHHHAHNEWAIGGIVVRLARELAVPYVRLARNCGPGIGALPRLYKLAFNGRLRRAGLARTRFFGDVRDWEWVAGRRTAAAALDDFELMTHPVLAEDGRLGDSEFPGAVLADLLAAVEPAHRATSFTGARYG